MAFRLDIKENLLRFREMKFNDYGVNTCGGID